MTNLAWSLVQTSIGEWYIGKLDKDSSDPSTGRVVLNDAWMMLHRVELVRAGPNQVVPQQVGPMIMPIAGSVEGLDGFGVINAEVVVTPSDQDAWSDRVQMVKDALFTVRTGIEKPPAGTIISPT